MVWGSSRTDPKGGQICGAPRGGWRSNGHRSVRRTLGHSVVNSEGRQDRRSLRSSIARSSGRACGRPLARSLVPSLGGSNAPSVSRSVGRRDARSVVRSFGVAFARSVAPSFHRAVARIVVRYAPRMARVLASCWGAFYEDGVATFQPSTSPVGGNSKEDGMGRQ